ncbi:HAUS augmin-like complex subunit 1 [Saguinus oedipus]|uniref:HAUS augmin-like complex subunit 1 n=1 Tax=Saguinus oedipus TaxID=9490 RepID=A0ABQ9UCF4_SAGOE|nr:HAUS augmin-like complex subunit 1 [Saguinus oedipus]
MYPYFGLLSQPCGCPGDHVGSGTSYAAVPRPNPVLEDESVTRSRGAAVLRTWAINSVAAWLKKIFGDHPIPQYEVNPRTTEILHHLSERNRVRDRDVYLVIEDLKQKASEYESEGVGEGSKYLQDLLMESVNFSPASLSSTSSRYLNALVDSAVALQTKDTSLASFIPAVNDLTSDLFRTKSKSEEIKIELEKLEKNLTATLEQLSARGMDASLSHQSLVALSEKLAKLKQQTIPLKKKLESYLDLMPNPSLAQVKIEEAKRELDSIEAELTRRVDMMEL